MSVDTTCYAVIGVEIPIGKLYRTEQVRNCSHTFDLSFQFCPVCGKPAKKEIEIQLFPDETIGTFKIIFTTDNDRAFVGVAAYTDYDNDDAALTPVPPDPAALLSTLADELSQIGAWNAETEDSFGLWAVKNVSY